MKTLEQLEKQCAKLGDKLEEDIIKKYSSMDNPEVMLVLYEIALKMFPKIRNRLGLDEK